MALNLLYIYISLLLIECEISARITASWRGKTYEKDYLIDRTDFSLNVEKCK
jgi:hypothetical protein